MVSLRKESRSATSGNISANAMLDLLRRFDPMADFDWHSLASIARHAREVVVPAGRVLVQPPRQLQGVWYLSAGSVRDETGARLRAGSARARQPIYPGCCELHTLSRVRLLFFGAQYAAMVQPQTLQNWPSAGVDMLSSTPSMDSRWLDTLAASPLLKLLYSRRGAQGWQRWLRELESVAVRKDGRLIAPGSPGDYFYIVQRGVARVQLSGCAGAPLVSVQPGGFFGEDALLSGQPRNATVVMPNGGRVLRGNAGQLLALVGDLWWGLARAQGSWRDDNQELLLRSNVATSSLRGWLGALPREARYGLPVDALDSQSSQSNQSIQTRQNAMHDLLLLLLVHRGYSVVLREGSSRRMQTLNGSSV